MNTIKHTEYKHNGRRVILDTCELAPGKYETMLLYPNGEEITSRTARTRSGRYKKRLSPHRISGTIYITGGNNNDPYQRAARPYRRSRGRI